MVEVRNCALLVLKDVAIGTDFDGGPTLARGIRDVRDLPMITDAMLRRSYSEERIDKFWGGNLLRCFRRLLRSKDEIFTMCACAEHGRPWHQG